MHGVATAAEAAMAVQPGTVGQVFIVMAIVLHAKADFAMVEAVTSPGSVSSCRKPRSGKPTDCLMTYVMPSLSPSSHCPSSSFFPTP